MPFLSLYPKCAFCSTPFMNFIVSEGLTASLIIIKVIIINIIITLYYSPFRKIKTSSFFLGTYRKNELVYFVIH